MENNRSGRKETFKISTLETDMEGSMKLGALCNRMQEIAWEDADDEGFGFNELRSRDLLWLLSRIHIEIERMPQWKDEVHLYTWAKCVDGIFAIRDFVLEDTSGNILVKSTSSWVVINYQNRKIRRPEAIKELPQSFVDNCAIDKRAAKIKSPENREFLSRFQAHYCDLDIVGHLNNTRYVDWVQNSFPIETYKTLRVKTFTINFLSEVLGGNEVELYGSNREKGKDFWTLEGKNINKNDFSFRAAVEWTKK